MLRKNRDSKTAPGRLPQEERWQTVFEAWARRRVSNAGLPRGRLALALQLWEPEPGLARKLERESAVRAAESAWSGVFGETPLDPGLIRRGDGPRTGKGVRSGAQAEWLWVGSLSHSSPAGSALAGVLGVPVRHAKDGSKPSSVLPLALGVDIEPISRRLHPRMESKLRPRPECEAPGIGRVPLLAQWCVKEAIFKADQRQEGRIIADYDWIQVRKIRGRTEGWQGWARHFREEETRFAVSVVRVGNVWVALALGFSEPQGRD